VSLLLLRHVHAGDRAAWRGDDAQRPVSERGQRQAAALVERFADRPIVALVTSPAVRCLQSVEPLATARGLEVEEAEDLAEGSPPDLVRRFLRRQHARARDLAGEVVLCSHGDVIGDVVRGLAARGVDLGGPARWPKASTWVLLDPPPTEHDEGGERGEDGEVRVRYLPPPA
jgi:phosphohistidine phosphatase SixA